MAEEEEGRGANASGGGIDPAAMAFALRQSGGLDPRAAAYLEEQARLSKNQSRLAELQSQNLIEQNAFELSHLRWRRFNDQMKGAMQIMLVAVAALIVAVIGLSMWNASRADGLVVEGFSVPPDFERQGMSADVVAGDVTEKLVAIRKIANENSFSVSNDVSAARANDIKVEIPETGISISEAWRYLRRWLGHERHLTGSLRDTRDGRIALSVSLDGASAVTASGAAEDLPAIEMKAAENVFGAFDPVNFVNYLNATGRRREAMNEAAAFVPVTQGLLHADAFTLWSYTTVNATGDIGLGLARAHIAIGLYPSLAVAHVMAARFYFFLGHDEQVLTENRVILTLRNEDQPPAHQHGGFKQMQDHAAAQIAELEGDYAKAVPLQCLHGCSFPNLTVTKAAQVARLHDVRGAGSLLREGLASGAPDPDDVSEARYFIDAEEGEWRAAAGQAGNIHPFARAGDMSPRFLATVEATYATPLLAVAQAHAGAFAGAHAAIDTTPRDCVPCLTARGEIDALEKKENGAAFWFARAAAAAPSIPFADADWGAMLLHKGDYDGAIAKFARAHAKGPHFADPLEMWGEALMLKNRSDLALSKFEEANRYAPNWGRLHLKWGEALMWSGDRQAARKQFAIASKLDLTVPDRKELARMSA